MKTVSDAVTLILEVHRENRLWMEKVVAYLSLVKHADKKDLEEEAKKLLAEFHEITKCK